ncbi:MAG: prepilin-type N-terminal cleavage/methylation domain-containing protein [Phycisphaera sp.]|nr:prepilin-type N-terminal cleavage/methylation domain-containing protein [Phycisphaera sp.]
MSRPVLDMPISPSPLRERAGMRVKRSCTSHVSRAMRRVRRIDPLTQPLPHPGERGSARRARGFTFVEVLAAMLLMAIVLPVAMRGITLALRAESDAADRTEALMLAQSKLAELVATGDWQDGSLEGAFDETPSGESMHATDASAADDGPAGRFTWSAQVEDWLDSRVSQLAVTVTWPSRGAERSVTLTTLVGTEATQ